MPPIPQKGGHSRIFISPYPYSPSLLVKSSAYISTSCTHVLLYPILSSSNWTSPTKTLDFTLIHFPHKCSNPHPLSMTKLPQCISFNPCYYTTFHYSPMFPCHIFYINFHCSLSPILSCHMPLLNDYFHSRHSCLLCLILCPRLVHRSMLAVEYYS